MQSLPYVDGIAAPLPIANLDTDQIMPKQFLRGIDKEGLGQGVLYDLRFGPDGLPRTDFVLNQDAYSETHVLIGAENSGCGSSREHPVGALLQYGTIGKESGRESGCKSVNALGVAVILKKKTKQTQ